MKIYKTIVVEDEGPARRRLEMMVKQHPALSLLSSLKSGREAITQIPILQPDLLLLDIQLKDKTAFEVLQQIQTSINSHIIFITAYDRYAIKAFEVEATDYLLKPYDYDRFVQAIARIVKKDQRPIDAQLLQKVQLQAQPALTQVVIPEGSKNHLFHPEDILLIKSDKYYAYFITPEKEKLIRITLKKLESLLPSSFVRVNKSCIVNTFHLIEYHYNKRSGYLVMSNGDRVDISRSYLPKLKTIFP